MSDTKAVPPKLPQESWLTPEHRAALEEISTASVGSLVQRFIGGEENAVPLYGDLVAALRIAAIKAEDRGNSYLHLSKEISGEQVVVSRADLQARRDFLQNKREEGESDLRYALDIIDRWLTPPSDGGQS
jgi:hypothetical protein